jgi:hypothetical protein
VKLSPSRPQAVVSSPPGIPVPSGERRSPSGQGRNRALVPSNRLRLPALLSLFFFLSCGDGGPLGLDTSNLEILVVQGDDQAAEPGDLLADPMKVRVQRRGSGVAVEGAKVRWEILDGLGATLDPPVSETDSLGLTSTRFRLGPAFGTYRVRAFVRGMESLPVEFSAEAIQVPELGFVPLEPVQAGDTILLQGSNFALKPPQNVVTFSGIRGRVVTASSGELRVEVPPCLLARDYQVRVRIGALTTNPASLRVAGGTSSLSLARGEDRVVDASEGYNCLHLSPSVGSLYLVVPHSTGTVVGAEHGFSLVGLTSDGASPAPSVPGPFSSEAWRTLGVSPPTALPGMAFDRFLDVQDRWDERLRVLEAELLAERGPFMSTEAFRGARSSGTSATPVLGEKREFKVLNSKSGFDRVTARVRFITEHTVVYLDEDVPAGGFTEDDLEAIALEFETPVHGIITGTFGGESDLDSNGRIIILFTPAVNRLTQSGSDGFVGGFFYGLDLLEGRTGSNGGEIFYAMVPDPTGKEGPVISRYTALSTIPSVMAHEFEHMVHFNQRIFLKGAESQEALWLSEALAQMAEDLIGAHFDEAHQPSKAIEYRTGNWVRARRFLQNTAGVSVLASLPPGTLAERGAGWLFLKQVKGRPGQEALLGRLVSSVLSGTENVTESVGLEWGELVADWAGSLFLDGTGVPVRPELRVTGVDLREVLSESDGSYPLSALAFGGHSGLFAGTLWSSAPNYFIISPPSNGGLALAASGAEGRLPEAAMGLQVLVVRLQ